MGNVLAFRACLSRISASRVLIIGHNGWSRNAFSSGLMAPCLDHDREQPLRRLAFGGREIRQLRNVGMLTAHYAAGSFHAMRNESQGDNVKTCSKKTQFALFTSILEAKTAGHIPQDAVVQRLMVAKTQDYSGDAQRLLTFSASGGKSYLAWSDKWGAPKKFIDLTEDGIEYACDDTKLEVRLFHSLGIPVYDSFAVSKSTVAPFYLKANSAADYTKLCDFITTFMRYAQGTKFISDVVSVL